VKRAPIIDPGPEFWREVDFPWVDDALEGLRPYVERLRAAYANGDVIHRTFLFPEQAELRQQAQLAFARDRAFFRHFWHCPSVKAALPYELHESEFAETELGPGHPFRWSTPVELPGQLADPVRRGGAYGGNTPTAREAMASGMAAAESLTQGDFDNTRVLNSRASWSRFFHDVAWDYTWILVHPDRGRIVVLMATDTD
jgi:hypothetical protein